MAAPKVVSLGQCGVDHGSISRLLRGSLQANVVAADTFDEAREAIVRGDVTLVLVNRVLDRTGESGLDFIRGLKADPALAAVPVMLVSNYADAQRQAVELGALPGFGKDALGRPETLATLRSALADTAASRA
jgi:CheY-like chemotaxis protein